MNPIVSVIMAVHDGERFLRNSLDSVFAQDFDEYEVILVDDGSTDSTSEIARSYPLRYLAQANKGLSAARNAGLALAQGRFVAFLDDDDVLPPTKLRLQATYLLDHPDVDCVLGRQEWIFEDGVAPPEMARDPVFGDLGGVGLASLMIKRSVLADLCGFDESYRYAEDRDLFVRLRENGFSIEVLPEVVLFRRLHGANMILSPPLSHPLLRSLREKLERERAREGAGDA